MNNDDTEIVCDDFIVEDFFICECGVTFSDEETLQSHLESSHTVPKSEQTEAVEEQTSFPFEHMDISDIDVKEEVNIEDQRVLSLPSSSKTVAVLVTSDGVQSCKEVDFAEGPVILVGENIEHDYGTCLPKAEVQDLYFCDQCGRSFDNPKSVRLHKSRLHTPEGAPKVRFMRRGVCQLCHTAYTDVEQSAVCECGGKLVRGKRLRVAPGTLYTCEHCGATRQSAAALRYHLRTHTGEKPYACEHCDKAFSMPIFLQIHTRIHTGERPYPCKLCPKAFTNKAAWNRHARVHTGEKPYVCSECGKAFSQSNSMKLHIHTVHLRLPTPYKSQQRRRHQNALELRPKTSKSKGRQVLSTIDDGVATVSPATARLLAAGGLFRHKDDTLRRLDRLRYEEEEEEEMDSEEDVLVEETEYYEIQDAEGHSFIRTSPVAVDFALTPHQRFFVDK